MKSIESGLKFRNELEKLNKTSMIVIHHAAHSSAAVLDIHGWSGFGYCFFITKDEQIHKGQA